MAGREEVLARAQQLQERREPVHVPEWREEPVYIRVLGAKEALTLTDSPGDLPFAILVATLCEEDGSPFFQPGDEKVLEHLPLKEIGPLFREAARINGLTEESVEEAVARFGQAPGESTPSA